MTAIRVDDGRGDFRRLQVRLAAVPKAARSQVGRAVREAAEQVRQQAASNASWSTRIPSSLTVRLSFSVARSAAYVASSSRQAPSARPWEGITGRDRLRHPLNYPSQRGGRGGQARHWVSQPVRPFLEPAIQSAEPAVVQRLIDAVDAALRDAGL